MVSGFCGKSKLTRFEPRSRQSTAKTNLDESAKF
jgi:hypothetical protein